MLSQVNFLPLFISRLTLNIEKVAQRLLFYFETQIWRIWRVFTVKKIALKFVKVSLWFQRPCDRSTFAYVSDLVGFDDFVYLFPANKSKSIYPHLKFDKLNLASKFRWYQMLHRVELQKSGYPSFVVLPRHSWKKCLLSKNNIHWSWKVYVFFQNDWHILVVSLTWLIHWYCCCCWCIILSSCCSVILNWAVCCCWVASSCRRNTSWVPK